MINGIGGIKKNSVTFAFKFFDRLTTSLKPGFDHCQWRSRIIANDRLIIPVPTDKRWPITTRFEFKTPLPDQ
jgi:hypothetical protein